MAYPVHVRIEDVRHPDGGHALIVFTGNIGGAADGLVIRRFDRVENNLSHDGWRVPESRLQPLSIEASGNELRVLVGPDVTEWIEFGERVELALPGTEIRALASWPEIGAFTGGDVRRWRRLMTGQRSVQQPRPVPPPQQDAGPPPLPAAQTVVTPLFAPPESATMIRPASTIPPVPPPLSATPEITRRNTAAIGGVVVATLLLAAGGAGYWYYDNYVRDRTPPPPSPPPPPPVAQSPPPPPPIAQSPPPPPPPPAAQRLPTTQDELVVRIAGLSPPQVHDLAEQLMRQRSFDLALLAFEDAARRGHGPAHTAIGRMYDPATHQRGQPFQNPNPRKAVEHYMKAIEGGHAAARPLLDALTTRLRQQASGTGREAQEAQEILRDFRLSQ